MAEIINRHPKVTGQNVQVYIGPELNNILESALKEAEKLKDDYVSTEHILIAMSESRGKAGELLRQNGVTKKGYLKYLLNCVATREFLTRIRRINTRL